MLAHARRGALLAVGVVALLAVTGSAVASGLLAGSDEPPPVSLPTWESDYVGGG